MTYLGVAEGDPRRCARDREAANANGTTSHPFFEPSFDKFDGGGGEKGYRDVEYPYKSVD